MSASLFFANNCDSAPRDEAPEAPAPSGVRLRGVSVTTAGFEILDARGEVVAWREHVEDALVTQRDMDEGEDVRRVSDGALIATKHRVKGAHLYAAIWDLDREPEWQPR